MRCLIHLRLGFLASLSLLAGGVCLTVAFTLSGCTSAPKPSSEQTSQPVVQTAKDAQPGQVPIGSQAVQETQTGSATFISSEFQGKKTASGEPYKQDQLVAAHSSYPLGTVVRVVNLKNGRTAEVRIIDRSSAKGAGEPIIDLSWATAEQLGFTKEGEAKVRVEVLKRAG